MFLAWLGAVVLLLLHRATLGPHHILLKIMDIVTTAETESSEQNYIPFVFTDGFPGFLRDYNTGVTISKVDLGNQLQFLQPLGSNYPDAKSFNRAILRMFEQAERSKCFDQLSLKIEKSKHHSDIPDLQISLFPKAKSLLPKYDEWLANRGLYLHLQLANQFSLGERFRTGILLKQRQYSYLSCFRMPVDQSILKLRIEQAHILGSIAPPLKQVQLVLQKYQEIPNCKKVQGYQIKYLQRFEEHTVYNGIGVGWRQIDVQKQMKQMGYNYKDIMEGSVMLWPTIGKSEFALSYRVKFELALAHLIPNPMFRAVKSNISAEYSSLGLTASQTVPGFTNVASSKFRLTANNLLYINPKSILRNYNVLPFVSQSLAYCPGVEDPLKVSIGLGWEMNLQKYHLNFRYNLAQYHGVKDKPISFEITLD